MEADPSTGQNEDERDELRKNREDPRDRFSEIREDRRDGFTKIREDSDDGFVQSSKRKTCERLEKTDGTTNANRSRKFEVLSLTEGGLEVEEVSAVDEVQQIVEITVGWRVAKSVWPIQQKCVARTETTKMLSLAAAKGSPIRLEGDARLQFVREGKKCNLKFFDVRPKDSWLPCVRLSTRDTSSSSDRRSRTWRTRAQACLWRSSSRKRVRARRKNGRFDEPSTN